MAISDTFAANADVICTLMIKNGQNSCILTPVPLIPLFPSWTPRTFIISCWIPKRIGLKRPNLMRNSMRSMNILTVLWRIGIKITSSSFSLSVHSRKQNDNKRENRMIDFNCVSL